MGRHVLAHRGDLLQLGPSPRICFVRGHLAGQLRVPVGEAASRHHRRCPWPAAVRACRRPAGRPESPAGRSRPAISRLKFESSPCVDLVVQNGVARGPLLHELREHPRFVGGEPLGRHGRKDLVPHAAARASRGSPCARRPARHSARNRVAGFRTRIEDLADPPGCGRSTPDKWARPWVAGRVRRR